MQEEHLRHWSNVPHSSLYGNMEIGFLSNSGIGGGGHSSVTGLPVVSHCNLISEICGFSSNSDCYHLSQ